MKQQMECEKGGEGIFNKTHPNAQTSLFFNPRSPTSCVPPLGDFFRKALFRPRGEGYGMHGTCPSRCIIITGLLFSVFHVMYFNTSKRVEHSRLLVCVELPRNCVQACACWLTLESMSFQYHTDAPGDFSPGLLLNFGRRPPYLILSSGTIFRAILSLRPPGFGFTVFLPCTFQP